MKAKTNTAPTLETKIDDWSEYDTFKVEKSTILTLTFIRVTVEINTISLHLT